MTLFINYKKNSLTRPVQRPAITKHLKNIFDSGELDENSVGSILEHTAEDGKNFLIASNSMPLKPNRGQIALP